MNSTAKILSPGFLCVFRSSCFAPSSLLPKLRSGSFLRMANQRRSRDGSLIEGRDGNFYGVSDNGGFLPDGTVGKGTIFRVAPDGTFSNIYVFSGADGKYPQGPLTLGSDGAFYGATVNGDLSMVARFLNSYRQEGSNHIGFPCWR